MRTIIYIGSLAAVAILSAVFSGRDAQSVTPADAVPYSIARNVAGLVSSGTFTSVEWGNPNIVTVPDSWAAMKATSRRSHIDAVWDAAPNKHAVVVVDESGSVLIEYSP